MKLWSKIILLLLIPQLCYAQMMVQNRDIKQPAETKLFISSNHLVPDFQDVSSSNNPITKYADVKTVNQASVTNPKYFPVGNDKGIYFDGTGDYLSIADNTDLEIGSDDFTIDFWFYTNSLVAGGATKQILGKYITAGNQEEYFIHLDENEKIVAGYTTNGSTDITMISANAVSLNTWYHISFIHSGSDILLFVDGILQETDSGVDTIFAGTAAFTIASYNGATTGNHSGFLQNIRVSKGIARWTSNFTPPALNSTYETDEYTKLYIKGHDKAVNTTAMTDIATSKTITTSGDTKIGYSRGVASYFDGTGDWIAIPDSTDLEVGSDDFTFEFWFQNTRQIASSVNYVGGKYYADGNQRGYVFSLAATDEHFQFDYSKTGADAYTMVTSATTINKWHHACFVKNGTDILLFLDGVLQETDTGVTSIFGGTSLFSVGCLFNNSLYAQGFCSGLRVSKGIARYTTNFTPPETEPVADSYTKLLLKQNMLKIPDIATAKTINIVGNTTISTAQIKTGKNSIYFDGNNDKLYCLDSEDFEFGAGDFTFDMWFNTSTLVGVGTDDYIAGKWQPAGNQREYGFKLNEDEKIVFYYSTNGTALTTMLSVNAISINTWYHIAAVKSGTNIYLFVNGILQETDTGISSIFDGNASIQFGGWESVSTDCMNGYLSDIRVTKGKALWTSNFTPPRRSGAY